MSSVEEPQEYNLSEFDRSVRKAVANYLKTPSALPPEFLGYLGPYLETQNIQLPISSVVGNFLVETNTTELGGNIHGRTGMVRAGSTPFDFFQMTYDSVYGKWVSNPMTVLVGGSIVTASTTDVTAVRGGILPFEVYDAAGLEPQIRYSVFMSNAGGFTSTATLVINTTPVDGGATVQQSISLTTTSTTIITKDSGWTAYTGTVDDFLVFTANVKTSNAGGSASYQGSIALLRWVSQ